MATVLIGIIVSITTPNCFANTANPTVPSTTSTTTFHSVSSSGAMNPINTSPNFDAPLTYLIYGIIGGATCTLHCILMTICIYYVYKKHKLQKQFKTKIKNQSTPFDEHTNNQSYPIQLQILSENRDEYDLTASGTIQQSNMDETITGVEETIGEIMENHVSNKDKSYTHESEKNICDKININTLGLSSPTIATNQSFPSEPPLPEPNLNEKQSSQKRDMFNIPINMLDKPSISSSLSYNFMHSEIQRSQPIPIPSFGTNVYNYGCHNTEYERRNRLYPMQLRNECECDLTVQESNVDNYDINEIVNEIEESNHTDVMENILKNVLAEQSVGYYENKSETDESENVNGLSVYLSNDIIDR